MSVDLMIPELWSARLLVQFDRMNVWQPLFNDVSRWLRRDGDKVHMGEITSEPTIADYARYTALAAPDRITTIEHVLTIDQMKAFSFVIDDVDRTQTRPALMDEVARRTAVRMGNLINDHLRETFEAAVPSANPDNQLTTAEQITGSDFAKQMLEQIADVGEAMDAAYVPRDMRFAVMSPGVFWKLVEKLTGETTQSAYRVESFIQAILPNLFGFRPIVDAGIPTAGNKRHRVYLGRPNQYGNNAAYQIRTLEGFRSHDYFGDIVRGLYVYGADCFEGDWNYYIQPATQ